MNFLSEKKLFDIVVDVNYLFPAFFHTINRSNSSSVEKFVLSKKLGTAAEKAGVRL